LGLTDEVAQSRKQNSGGRLRGDQWVPASELNAVCNVTERIIGKLKEGTAAGGWAMAERCSMRLPDGDGRKDLLFFRSAK
jgi:hypothetical protein